MRVLVLGGAGFIGSYVVARLHGAGHEVTGASRAVAAAARRMPFAQWKRIDRSALTRPEAWAPHLEGIDVVVNGAGALQDGAGDDLAAVHESGATALFRACASHGVRVVHISAAGVGADAPTAFFATKFRGEEGLRAAAPSFVILRPGLVLAPGAFGGSALLRGLAAFPCVIPAFAPETIVQVVSAEDVAEAVLRTLEPGVAQGASIDLVHAAPTTLADILRSLRGWLGLRPAAIVTIPRPLVRICARAADALAWLGWTSPLRSTAVRQLEHGVRGGGHEGAVLRGFTPRSLDEMLAGWPSSLQDRRAARLYWLRPVIFAVLAAFWIVSGVIGLTAGHERAVEILRSAGFGSGTAAAAVIAGSFVDLGLGLALGLRRSAGAAMVGMIIVSAAYLIGASLFIPALWADPLGPLVKAIPGLVLALVGLALLDER